MGIFKIFTNSTDIKSRFYISYHTNLSNNEIALNASDLINDQYYYQLLGSESSVIQRWAQNLHQTPEEYMSQLCVALKEQLSKTDDNTHESKEQKEVSLQNIFEVDGECNLVWKQFFESKKIFGRKGKFCLVEKSREEVLGATLHSLMDELRDRESAVSHLEKENKTIKKEHEDLRTIAENSVTMKENFEQEIYGKFAVLLNTKKRQNAELRNRLRDAQEKDMAVAGPSNTKAPNDRMTNKNKDGSDDEYDIDTDADSPDEVEALNEDAPSSSTLMKRKGNSNISDSDKKSKSRKKNASSHDVFSEDFLNDSLAAELDVGSFSSHNIKRKF